MGIMVFVLGTDAYAATTPTAKCQACMAYISCNASKYFYNKLDAASAKTFCDNRSNAAIAAMCTESPYMCEDLADLGWRMGQDYDYDANTGMSAEHLQEQLHQIALIAARRCMEHGVCEFPDANYFWAGVGVQNDAQQALVVQMIYSQCPNGGKSDYGDNFSLNKCYLTGNFNDDTGAGEYSDKCYYVYD